MTLLAQVVGRLRERGLPCALIGAEALALRGVSRATADRDDRDAVIGEVRDRLEELPADCRRL